MAFLTLMGASYFSPASAAAAPEKTDVMFIFDTSGSMNSELEEAKLKILGVIEHVRSSLPNVAVGVANVEDIPGYSEGSFTGTLTEQEYAESPEKPWRLDQPVTTEASAATGAIQNLTIGGGGDGPEAYSRALWETNTNPTVGWRPGARHEIVLVADNVPHDPNLNVGLPESEWLENPFDTHEEPGGKWGIPNTQWNATVNLGIRSVAAELGSDGKPLESVEFYGGEGHYLPYWEYWAGLSGGEAVEGASEQLEATLISAIETGANRALLPCPSGESRNTEGICATTAQPSGVTASSEANGATVSWEDAAPTGVVSAFHIREVEPNGTPGSIIASAPGNATSVKVSALLNCRPVRFEVQATGAAGTSAWSGPSIVVVPHESPPSKPRVAVILMEGVDSVSPAETYYLGAPAATAHTGVSSYCYASDGPVKTSLPSSLESLVENFNPRYNVEASGGPDSMTDSFVGQGGVVLLPWSFRGVWIDTSDPAAPLVHVNASSAEESDQIPIDTDAAALAQEVASVHKAWPGTKIAIVAHSLGGLIAEQYWEYYWRSNHDGVSRIIALDAPINGTKLVGGCSLIVKPGVCPRFSYAVANFMASLWTSMEWHDPAISANDRNGAFLPVGTEGDSVYTLTNLGTDSLISQLLFACGGWPVETCNPLPPGFLSPCPSEEHAEVKACPGVISYVDDAIFGNSLASAARARGARADAAQADLSVLEPTLPVATVAAASHQPHVPLMRVVQGRPWAVPDSVVAKIGRALSLKGAHLGVAPGVMTFSGAGGHSIAADIVSWAENAITVRVPPSAVSGPVAITTADGTTVPVLGIAVLGSTNAVRGLSSPASLTMQVGASSQLTVRARGRSGPLAGQLISIFDGASVRFARTRHNGTAHFTLNSEIADQLVVYAGDVWHLVHIRWQSSAVTSVSLTAKVHDVHGRRKLLVTVLAHGRHPGGAEIALAVTSATGSSYRATVRIGRSGRGVLNVNAPSSGTVIVTATSDGTSAKRVLRL
jgi:pimeloyl-ACP methyl ester carboxylesterase